MAHNNQSELYVKNPWFSILGHKIYISYKLELSHLLLNIFEILLEFI